MIPFRTMRIFGSIYILASVIQAMPAGRVSNVQSGIALHSRWAVDRHDFSGRRGTF